MIGTGTAIFLIAVGAVLRVRPGARFPGRPGVSYAGSDEAGFAGEHDGLGRSRRPTLAKMWQTWVSPVCPAMTTVSLMSALEGPWAISRSTSVSRLVSAPGGAGAGEARDELAGAGGSAAHLRPRPVEPRGPARRRSQP